MQERRLVGVLEAVARQPPGDLPTRLCAAAAEHLASPGVALSLMIDDTVLQSVATTADGVGPESLQADLGEGPSWDAHRNGTPCLAPDLSDDGQWPALSPAAVNAGTLAVFAFPLRSGQVRLGTLSLYRPLAGDLDADQHADALLFTRLALDVCLALQAGHVGSELDALLDAGARNSAEVHQATGMASVQLGIDVGQALAVLRARAYADGRTLPDLAHDVVARRVRLDNDNSQPPDQA